MKRRIAFTLAAIMATTMLSACGGNTPSETQQQTSGTDSGTSAVTTESSTSSADTTSSAPETTTSATTSETTTAAPEEPEVPEEIKLMTSEPNFFDDGCMVFRDVTDTCIYNIAEKELYVHNEAENGRILSVSGNIAIIDASNDPYSTIDRDGGMHNLYFEPVQDVNIVNLKTGETIVSCTQDNNTYCYLSYDLDNPTKWKSSYIPVIRVDKSFSGDKYSFGALNNKGEWAVPMSADYEICKIGVTDIMAANEEQWIFGKYLQSSYYYNIKNNTFSDMEPAYIDKILYREYTKISFNFIGGVPTVYLDGKVRINGVELDGAELCYDPATNSCDKLAIETELKQIDNGYYLDSDKRVYDKDYNKYDYDLSEYNVRKISAVSEDYIVFTARNENKDDYEIIMKKDGSFVCEPFIGSAFLKGDSVIISQYVNEQAEWSILDCTTGEISKLAYEYDSYDRTSGMLVVKSDNAYYLLDPETPDTLINPFEGAIN